VEGVKHWEAVRQLNGLRIKRVLRHDVCTHSSELFEEEL